MGPPERTDRAMHSVAERRAADPEGGGRRALGLPLQPGAYGLGLSVRERRQVERRPSRRGVVLLGFLLVGFGLGVGSKRPRPPLAEPLADEVPRDASRPRGQEHAPTRVPERREIGRQDPRQSLVGDILGLADVEPGGGALGRAGGQKRPAQLRAAGLAVSLDERKKPLDGQWVPPSRLPGIGPRRCPSDQNTGIPTRGKPRQVDDILTPPRPRLTVECVSLRLEVRKWLTYVGIAFGT
jgi:hypothetical protein